MDLLAFPGFLFCFVLSVSISHKTAIILFIPVAAVRGVVGLDVAVPAGAAWAPGHGKTFPESQTA